MIDHVGLARQDWHVTSKRRIGLDSVKVLFYKHTCLFKFIYTKTIHKFEKEFRG